MNLKNRPSERSRRQKVTYPMISFTRNVHNMYSIRDSSPSWTPGTAATWAGNEDSVMGSRSPGSHANVSDHVDETVSRLCECVKCHCVGYFKVTDFMLCELDLYQKIAGDSVMKVTNVDKAFFKKKIYYPKRNQTLPPREPAGSSSRDPAAA